MRPERPAARCGRAGRIAVALHDVEPESFERCALIRDWLDDHGIDRVTLLVIPAPDLHHFHDTRPELAEWLTERVRAGDTVAQHGFHHECLRGGGTAEFRGLDGAETRRAVDAGRRVLKLAGVEPRGFVAPGYVYTDVLRETLRTSFDWWAGLLRLHRRAAARHVALSPAFALGDGGSLRRAAAPLTLRAGAALAGDLLRLDLHPADLRRGRDVAAVEAVLRAARRRTAVTYDDLLG